MKESELLVLKFRMVLLIVCCICFIGSLFFLNSTSDETVAVIMAIISFWGAYKIYDDISDQLRGEPEPAPYEEPEELEDITELTDANLDYILTLLDDGDIDVEDAKIKIMSLVEETA
jgi:hypothetical protein